MLQATAIVLAALVTALLLFAATKPDTFQVSRSITIDAPAATVFAFLDDFRRWKAWSPWEDIDPAMVRTFSGPASGTGAVYEWDGDRHAGQGRMEITEADPPSRLEIRLDFVRPWRSTNRVQFKLDAREGATDVTWSMEGPNTYFGKVMSVFVSMDKLIGKDYVAGLANLKELVEGERSIPAV